MIPKPLSLKDHKNKAKRCGCIMCMMVLRNIESPIHYYAMRMNLTKKVNRFHRGWARSNRRHFINQLMIINGLPAEFHENKKIQPQE